MQDIAAIKEGRVVTQESIGLPPCTEGKWCDRVIELPEAERAEGCQMLECKHYHPRDHILRLKTHIYLDIARLSAVLTSMVNSAFESEIFDETDIVCIGMASEMV